MESIRPELQKFYSGKKILITGGNGYLGSNLVNQLLNFECQIYCLDRLKLNQDLEIDKKAKLISIVCDITDSSIWQKILSGIDIIFHFAGQTSAYVANEDPIKDFNINVLPLLFMLESCRKNKYCPTILFAGTATEVGIPRKLPVDENHHDKPVTIYDIDKLMAEGYLKYYANAEIVKGTILRLANVYGPGPKSSSADRGILNMMIRKALNGEDLTLYGKGEFIRDYIFVDDVINAFLIAGMKIENMNGRHFVLGTGVGHSIREAFETIIESVFDFTKKKVEIISTNPPQTLSPIESRNFIANVGSLKQSIGWIPEVTLAQGINKTVKHYDILTQEQKLK